MKHCFLWSDCCSITTGCCPFSLLLLPWSWRIHSSVSHSHTNSYIVLVLFSLVLLICIQFLFLFFVLFLYTYSFCFTNVRLVVYLLIRIVCFVNIFFLFSFLMHSFFYFVNICVLFWFGLVWLETQFLCLSSELFSISLCREANTIFRGNSLATRCIDDMMKIVGKSYLTVTLKPVLNEVKHTRFLKLIFFFLLMLTEHLYKCIEICGSDLLQLLTQTHTV